MPKRSDQLTPESFVNLFERPDIALANALGGNLDGMVRAIWNPDTLAPSERQRMIYKMFGDGGPPDALRDILGITLNPAVILGAVLTLKFPIKNSPDEMLHVAQNRTALRKLLPLYDHIASFDELFGGTTLPDLFHELISRTATSQELGRQRLAEGLQQFREIANRLPTENEFLRVAAVADDVTNPNAPVWQALADAYKGKPEAEIIKGHLAELSKNRITKSSLSPAEKRLHFKIEQYLGDQYNRVGGDAGAERALKRRFIKDPGKMPGRKLSSYWPHRLAQTPQEAKTATDLVVDNIVSKGRYVDDVTIMGPRGFKLSVHELEGITNDIIHEHPDIAPKNLMRAVNEKLKQIHSERMGGMVTKVTAPSQVARFDKMLPDSKALRALGGPLAKLADFVDKAEYIPEGELQAVKYRQYRMDFNTLRSHNHANARVYAWSVAPRGYESTIGELVQEQYDHLAGNIKGSKIARDPLRAGILKDYISGTVREQSPAQMMQTQWWNSMRKRADDFLGTKVAKKLVPSKLLGALREGILTDSIYGMRPISGSMAGWMYASTLGAPNLIAPIKNLFQTILTTYPTVGFQSTMAGIQHVSKSLTGMADDVMKGMTAPVSFIRRFNGFQRTHFDIDPGLADILGEADDAYQKALRLPGGIKDNIAKAQRMIMKPFGMTERFNRMVAYYAGRHFAEKNLPGRTMIDAFTNQNVTLEKSIPNAAREFGEQSGNMLERFTHRYGMAVSRNTQFAAGRTGSPYFLRDWPSLAKQLMQFPVRFLSFLTHGGWGRLGRVALASGAAVGLGAAVLGDSGEQMAEQATLFGAMPVPQRGSLFGMIPIVPPAAQLGGAAIKAAMGDPTELGRSLPLLVPGGVGMSRIAGLTGSTTVARVIKRSYTDFSQPGPDGRYPVYKWDGALEGFYTTGQLLAKSFGLGDVNTIQSRSLTQWMLKHGERISGMRRQYLDALSSNDQREADKIDQEYQRLFPGQGTIGDTIKQSHLRGLHLRRDVSLVERVLETQPPEIRAQFAGSISVALGQRGPGFLGLDEQGLGSGQTVRQRDLHRNRPATNPIAQAQARRQQPIALRGYQAEQSLQPDYQERLLGSYVPDL